MPATNFPHGAHSYGSAICGFGNILTTGNIFWVDSGAANASDSAKNGGRDAPYATIAFGITQCTASNGDIVFALPGHSESITDATTWDNNIQGVSVIGVGHGGDMPTVTLSFQTATSITVTAQNITFQNLHFIMAESDITEAIDINNAFCTIRDCLFTESGGSAVDCIRANTSLANHLLVEGCRFYLPTASGTRVMSVNGVKSIIRNNIIYSDTTAASIRIASTATGFCYGNIVFNADDTADNVIKVQSTAQALVADNRVGNADTQANQVLLGTSSVGVENYACVVTEDLSGILDPPIV